MIRNMDLIRGIVLAIRKHDGRPSATEVQSLVGNVDNAVFGYHIELLMQGAMMTGVDTGPRKDRYGVANLSLTWTGQDFGDNIVKDDVWANAKQKLDDAALESASFEIWTQLAVSEITKLLGDG